LRPCATAAIRRSPILPKRRNIRYAPAGSLTRASDDPTCSTAFIAPTLSNGKRYPRFGRDSDLVAAGTAQGTNGRLPATHLDESTLTSHDGDDRWPAFPRYGSGRSRRWPADDPMTQAIIDKPLGNP
jgi:hypothetical protein